MTYLNLGPVSREQWGTYCQHGKQLTEPDPLDSQEDHPRYRVVDPWPCDVEGCTLQALVADQARELEAYRADRQREYDDMVAGGVFGPGAGDWR